ncbi:MAG: hypothetical protein ACEPOZ_03390 [Marinifilaceae bacterium]
MKHSSSLTSNFELRKEKLRQQAILQEYERLHGKLRKNQKIIRLQGLLIALFGLLSFILLVH